MLKNIFKIIFIIILLLFILLIVFAVIRPEYIKYKQNKKEVVVDTSGERATSKNKVSDNEKNSSAQSKEYDSFTLDDRILLYEGDLNSDSMNKLIDILLEDIESTAFTKLDINLNGTELSYYDDKENYISNLNNFKNSIKQENNYYVEFEYNGIRSSIDKIIVRSK